MKKILFLFILFSITKTKAQITLTHNLDNKLVKINPTMCEEEVWAKAFTLSDFGVSTSDQFIIRSGQIAISNSYKGAKIFFSVFSIDDNFPNSEPKQIGYGGYMEIREIGDTPEIVEIKFNTPIVVPSKTEKILVTVAQLEDIYNPNYKKVLIAGSEKDNDKSWFKGCGNYVYASTDNLSSPILDANYFINVTGEKLSTINSDANVNLTHNIGDNPIQTYMFSCTAGYQYWGRKFNLSDFGVGENEEFIINKGFVGLSGAEWLSTVQFNIYKIDENFPSSFSESDLIGSSQVKEVPYFGYRYVGASARLFLVDFETPITIPADVTSILVEVHKGISYGDGEAFIAGTEVDNDDSWYRGCGGDPSGTYKTTKDLWGVTIPEWNNINFYITVNGKAKTILPFEIINDNNCINLINNFSLTNQSEIKSVQWNFDDISSGSDNTSNSINASHQFSSSGNYNISAEVTHIDDTNYTITKEIKIFNSPNINTSVSLKQCDNSDINGFSSINLNEAKMKIVSNPEDYTITFFEEKTLAENNTDPILNPITYTNQIVSNDVVWARVENNSGCFEISEIKLIISTTQIPSSFSKIFYKCDDGTNTSDGVATFDFSSVTQEVKDLFPIGQELIIKYYKSEIDALSESNEIINISNYQNIDSPKSQDIYIRVDSKLDNDCLALGHHITLIVDSIPIANSVTVAPQCDNDGDGLYDFDTSSVENTIVGSQTNIAVSYFDENNKALPSPLPNPFSTATQTITARVTNTSSQDPDGQCYDETTIKFTVISTPTANPISRQELCDADFDNIASFDTSAIENTLLGNQTGMIVKYFDQDDNPLPSPLPNPFATSSQTIRARVENPTYSICYDETIIEFIVNEKPLFELDSEALICITDNPSLDIKVKNPNGRYTYEWKDVHGKVISNSMTATISEGGTFFVKAISDVGCESNIESIDVRESSISSISVDDLEIVDDSENNSITINTQNIGLGNYEFSLLNSNSEIVYDYQDSPVFDNLEGDVYTILIKDIYGCGVQSFETSIISYPKFFTPNEDGIKDTWHILGIGQSFYKSGTVKIYNRFGRMLKVLSIYDSGWDGFYNGQKLPSNDYWFYAELITPKGNIIRKKGNFTLLSK